MIVGGEAEAVSSCHRCAFPAAAAKDPHLDIRAARPAPRGSISAFFDGNSPSRSSSSRSDLFGVTLWGRAGGSEQALLHGQPRRREQMGVGEPSGYPKAVWRVALGRRDPGCRHRVGSEGRPADRPSLRSTWPGKVASRRRTLRPWPGRCGGPSEPPLNLPGSSG